ncbi:hypothetical protein SLEP1_g22349 [Rubroshorea leprosula]|uniref:Uncharacterized protein n=1 Tax=Rubroshorea leprosula TaxID=152421 RepID=A0AAV5J8X6_9ROSI|nr:hypothetical protein SLEP1_g22349 [Rubroshorea leprosula]
MSSEGTMSVVGSEVMPLDYGSMDSESSPSPTSLERTVEERRDERVVEEEEEEIPSNILEAGSRVDGCYDPDLEVVSEVRGYVSELGSRSSLRGLVGNCKLPHHVLIRPAGVNERACLAPRDHWMPLNIHYLIAGLRFPIPELLVGLLLDYSIGITQSTPNAIRAGGRGEKGWYYFGPRSSSKGNKSLFSAGPSSIKGWKEKFFFVDDTEWTDKDEVEEVEKLVREEGDVVDIMYLTSPGAIKVVELYGPSSLSEAEMDSFINAAGGLAIPKKLRKKSKTSTAPRPKSVMGGSEEASKEVAPLQRKKRNVAETEVRRDEVVEFVPRPSPPEIDPKLREREEAVVRGPGKGKELPPPSYQKSLFEATNTTGAKQFLNATLPEVDRRQARQEAVSHLGAHIVRHALESASWVNALAQEYAESVRDCANWQRQLLPSVTELQSDNDVLSTKLVLEERKRKICEEKLEAQDKYIENMKKGAAKLKKNVNLLVHNGMEEHIGCFLNSSVFENIINLYWLPIAIVAFTDCRKKVKAQYPAVDVTMVTFGEQEEGVDEDGAYYLPSNLDVELVAVEEEEEEEAKGAGVENEVDLVEAQPPVVHPVSSDEVLQLAPPEAEVPLLPAEDKPLPPPLPVEEQPPPSAD